MIDVFLVSTVRLNVSTEHARVQYIAEHEADVLEVERSKKSWQVRMGEKGGASRARLSTLPGGQVWSHFPAREALKT
jgi:hypothetical protein